MKIKVITMEKCNFSLSRTDVLDTVQDFLKQNKIVKNFTAGRLGEDWFLNFKK